MCLIARGIGFVASISSIVLWIIMIFLNPYSPGTSLDVVINTFVTLLTPACVVLIGTYFNHSPAIYIGFVISLPISLYLLGTPGIFLFFGVTSFLYLITAVLFTVHNRFNSHREKTFQ
ncbi:hypothetical protein [Alkalihalobacillus sp. AL-G]|uniref:hypothetical protein n=1 Tax=Alkalihalobacillus sp. AL-G TaxID=2926399 RepID=UPI00272DB7E7|nr:hypothetical protein [Alkalihalobacillus sp. AL-G]WLD94310.1 hypothetical protein MOJ78_05300 [Alkalihalobacillus sp. AL-G]